MEHLQDDRLKRQRDEARNHFDDTTINSPIIITNSTSSTGTMSSSSSSSDNNEIANINREHHHHERSPEQVSRHYACPPTKLHELRKRYGTNKHEWGDWSRQETRAFYRTNLPRALQIDGALGLTLEERAKLASEARHALRIYARERCFLVRRLGSHVCPVMYSHSHMLTHIHAYIHTYIHTRYYSICLLHNSPTHSLYHLPSDHTCHPPLIPPHTTPLAQIPLPPSTYY